MTRKSLINVLKIIGILYLVLASLYLVNLLLPMGFEVGKVHDIIIIPAGVFAGWFAGYNFR